MVFGRISYIDLNTEVGIYEKKRFKEKNALSTKEKKEKKQADDQ